MHRYDRSGIQRSFQRMHSMRYKLYSTIDSKVHLISSLYLAVSRLLFLPLPLFRSSLLLFAIAQKLNMYHISYLMKTVHSFFFSYVLCSRVQCAATTKLPVNFTILIEKYCTVYLFICLFHVQCALNALAHTNTLTHAQLPFIMIIILCVAHSKTENTLWCLNSTSSFFFCIDNVCMAGSVGAAMTTTAIKPLEAVATTAAIARNPSIDLSICNTVARYRSEKC